MRGQAHAVFTLCILRSIESRTAGGVSSALPRCTTDECWQRYRGAHRTAEVRTSRVPPPATPKQLSQYFADRQMTKEETSRARAAYLHSEGHRMDMIRTGNTVAGIVRRQLMMRAVDEKGSSPQKVRLRVAEAAKVASHVVHGASRVSATTPRCGSRALASDPGLKHMGLVRQGTLHRTTLLQDPSMAQPGSGAIQTLKDEGLSTMGSVTPAEENGAEVAPFLKVFKDGFSNVACVKDTMYDSGDKYGNNRGKYKVGDTLNVSIVKYKEIVPREKQEAMSPLICYQFCRTVPDMVYFGIRSGADCYCTPFFESAEASSESCDMPCLGDTSRMCGGQNEKSSMFEMHMCSDTAGDVMYASVNAEAALVYFYDTAFITDKVAHHLQRGAELLERVAGGMGDSGATNLALAVKAEVSDLFDPKTGWGACMPFYQILLKTYKEAEDLYEADFSFAAEMKKADYTIQTENQMTDKLEKCAKDAETPILAAYPFYFEFMQALDEKDFQQTSDKHAVSIIGFDPILYTLNSREPSAMSSCEGDLIGQPMALSLAGCAKACAQANRKPRCVAAQYFQFMEGDDQLPLCFLFSKVKNVQSYKCDKLLPGRPKNSFLQVKRSTSEGSLRGPKGNQVQNGKEALCASIARIKSFSALSCESIFGKQSGVLKRCPKECKETDGAKHTAICLSNIIAGRPTPTVKQSTRCFGKDNEKADQASADFRITGFGADASGGAGPMIEGEIEMGGEVVEEPYAQVWTPGPAGQR